MAKLSDHAPLLDRLGKAKVSGHWNLSDRAWHRWRAEGVPRIHRKSLALFALVNGESSKELDQ